MSRHFLVLSVLSLSGIAGSLACGGGAPDTPSVFEASDAAAAPPVPGPAGSADAGAPTTAPPAEAPGATTSAATGDAGDEAAGPGNPQPAIDAAAPAAVSTLLAAGRYIRLDGVTDDGFVVYSTPGRVHAAPLDGGPETLIPARQPAVVQVSGGAVFSWSHLPVTPYLHLLAAWTSAHGEKYLTASFVPGMPLAASSDGTKVAFFAAGADGASPTLVLENADGTGAQSFPDVCATALTLGRSDDVIATDCAATFTDGGAPLPNVSVFAEPSFARTLLAPYQTYATDPTGTWLWLVGGDGGGKLVRASDGAPLFTDESVGPRAVFDDAGATLFYVAGGALKSVSTATLVAETLVPANCSDVLALSPDGAQVLFRRGLDVYLQPLAGNGAPTLVTSGLHPDGQYAFSSDSKYVLSQSTFFRGIWSYEAFPVAGGAPTVIPAAKSVTVLAGSSVLVAGADGKGRIVDLGNAGATRVLPGMGPFVVSKDGAKVAYVATGVEVPGLYVVSAADGDAGTVH